MQRGIKAEIRLVKGQVEVHTTVKQTFRGISQPKQYAPDMENCLKESNISAIE